MKGSISIFGLGYVGCVSAACLADAGHVVVGVDINAEKVGMINDGMSPIVEPGLQELMRSNVRSGRLWATVSCQEAVDQSELAFICVGTPGDQHGQLHADAMTRVCQEIGEALRGTERQFTVVVRSTMLPGTLKNIVLKSLLRGAGEAFRPWLRVAVNPEFIREGSALEDFAAPPFTLVGCEDPETAELLKDIYSGIDAPFVHTRVETAEMVKYVSNAYHALKVCFANEIGDSCDALGVDSQEVMRIFSLDEKLNISAAYLRPGFAFGGSCLPKDVKALLYAAHHANVAVPLLDAIMPSNQTQLKNGVDSVLATGKKRIGVLGLAFKPATDDLRESPLVSLVETLIGKGCDVRILDRSVAVAKLTGANRRYIVEEIPHISSLMCDQLSELMAHAEVLVIGSGSDQISAVYDQVRPDQVIIDLTRATSGKKASARIAA
jgi:GDP-mannose 6-dehydrogenase